MLTISIKYIAIVYFQIKKYNKKLAISFKNNFLLFKNKFQIFFNFSCCPKSLSINPKIKKVPKTITEAPIMFQQKLDTLLNKNSPLSTNLSFSFS